MRELPAALSAFAAYKQFVLYKTVPSTTRIGKTDKLPVDWRTGHVASAHDPAIWLDSQTAISLAATWGEPYGVGFVFTEGCPFWFLDIDDCIDDAGRYSDTALQIAQLLSGCAIEISQSGRGLHFFGTGKPPSHGCRNDALGLEFYDSGRFAALTGHSPVGSASTDASAVLPAIVAAYFPPDVTTASGEVEWTDGPVAEWRGITDDDELIRRAINSRSIASAFGNRASFADLWYANETVLREAYPDPIRVYDCSSADAALAQHLAFWTGKDCERIRRLMLRSGLVRDKWEREDYLPRTITGACSRQVDVYATPEPSVSPDNTPEQPPRRVFLGPEDQQSLFKGCIYITDNHKVLTPDGSLLKPDQFRVRYGGNSFVMDSGNERTSRDPWEAFTQSQLVRHPQVNGSCFRPDLPAAAIVNRAGLSYVNTYVPVDVPRKFGDPSPFLNHLARVLPHESDQQILLAYMAACVQHKGVKFQWAPLLQGVEGNGKTLFTRCVAEAVGRRYVHWPKASKLAKEFNAWMVGKLFFAVEDIYVPDARREVIEELKPMITGGDGLEIEAKGVDQTSADICGNFMFNSNHRDAIKKTANDRRFCVLFSAQQDVGDLQRDSLHGDYFPNLYRWLRSDGYAIVAEFLHTYAIPSRYNPAAECQRAPESSSTGAAISASAGTVEQEIQEQVAQGLPGFAGGWISSIFLDRLLERMGVHRKVSHSRRKDILEGLGYYWHPALKNGRVNNPVMPDGGKPVLYVSRESLACQITDAAQAAKSYETANTGRPGPTIAAPFALRG